MMQLQLRGLSEVRLLFHRKSLAHAWHQQVRLLMTVGGDNQQRFW